MEVGEIILMYGVLSSPLELTGDFEKDIDIAYLQTELEIYKKMNNEEVIYAIANMLFQYLDPKIKEQLDLKTHAILDERRQEYEKVVKLLADEKFQEAKEILLKLSKTFKSSSSKTLGVT